MCYICVVHAHLVNAHTKRTRCTCIQYMFNKYILVVYSECGAGECGVDFSRVLSLVASYIGSSNSIGAVVEARGSGEGPDVMASVRQLYSLFMIFPPSLVTLIDL